MGLKELSSFKKTAITLTALLLATGVVFASGTFLAQIGRDQVVNSLTMTTTPDPESPNWPAGVVGSPFAFKIKVANPTSQDIGHIHLELSVSCINSLTNAPITGDVIAAHVDANVCNGPVHSFSRALGPDTFVEWDFSVTYSPAGTALWTFTARLGGSP